jgi:hypothetical protein
VLCGEGGGLRLAVVREEERRPPTICRVRPLLLPYTTTICIRGLALAYQMQFLSSVAPLDLCPSLSAAMGSGRPLDGPCRGAGSEAHGRRRRLSACEPAPSRPGRDREEQQAAVLAPGRVEEYVFGGRREGGRETECD